MRLLRRGLRLRTRITIAFAVGGFLVSVMLAAITYGVSRNTVLDQREQASRQQFLTNARVVQDASRSESVDYGELLQSLPQLAGGQPIINLGNEDEWVSPSLTPADLPEALIAGVLQTGQAEQMRYEVPDGPRLAIGARLEPSGVAYFEVVTLNEVADNLRSLAITLSGAAVLTTLAAAGMGLWIGRTVLRPLVGVSAAAQAIAGGRLDTRLQARSDPDLTKLVASFNDMASALENRIERDARFASDVSHELRSPLMTLRASIEVLESRRSELSERAATALDLLREDVDRFQKLVEDLLEISRVDAGAADLALSEVSVVDLVQAVADSTGRSGQFPIALSRNLGDPVILADKRRLFQVIANLFDNADKYAGGVTGVVIDGDEDAVTVAVEDQGPGIPHAERHQVFERFSRGDQARRRGGGGGAGLGLALVAEHVRLHGGEVWVEDRARHQPGAKFVVRLPRRPGEN